MFQLRFLPARGPFHALSFKARLTGLLLVLPGGWLLVQTVCFPSVSVRAGLVVSAQIITSSYFGSDGDDTITALAYTPDGDIVLAGSSSKPGTFLAPLQAIGTAYSQPCSQNSPGGFLARLSPDGSLKRWMSYFDCGVLKINRLAVDSSGYIYIAGVAYDRFPNQPQFCDSSLLPAGGAAPFVAKLPSTGDILNWARLHQGADSSADVQLALTGQQSVIWGGKAGINGTNGTGASAANNLFFTSLSSDGLCGPDHVISDVDGSTAPGSLAQLLVNPANNYIYATGHFQRSLIVPFLAGFEAGGQEIWRDYDKPLPASINANSAGKALALAPDGSLLAAFVTDRTANLLEREPKNPTSPPLAQLGSAYKSTYGPDLGVPTYASFVGRYQADNGQILDATFFSATSPDGNTLYTVTNSLQVDAANQVYLSGIIDGFIPTGPDSFQKDYNNSFDGFLTVLNPELSSLTYSTYLGSSGLDNIYASAMQAGRLALGGFTKGTDLKTYRPFQAQRGVQDEGLLAVFLAPYELQKDVKLSILSYPQKIGAGISSGPVWVELQDSASNTPVKTGPGGLSLNLATSSGTGVLSASPGGPSVSSLAIPSGSARAAYYYQDSSIGNYILTVSGSNLVTQTQPGQVLSQAACEGLSRSQVNNSASGQPLDPCQITLEKALANGSPVTFPPAGITLIVTSPLPVLANPLDGGCQAGNPLVRLNGWSAGPVTGLELNGGAASLRGVAIYGFSGPGLQIDSGSKTLSCVFIGTPDGLSAQSNGSAVKILGGARLVVLPGARIVFWQQHPA